MVNICMGHIHLIDTYRLPFLIQSCPTSQQTLGILGVLGVLGVLGLLGVLGVLEVLRALGVLLESLELLEPLELLEYLEPLELLESLESAGSLDMYVLIKLRCLMKLYMPNNFRWINYSHADFSCTYKLVQTLYRWIFKFWHIGLQHTLVICCCPMVRLYSSANNQRWQYRSVVSWVCQNLSVTESIYCRSTLSRVMSSL